MAPGCRPRDWRREGRIAVLTVWVRAVGKVRVPSRPTSRAKKVGLQGLPWTRKHITIAVAVAQGGLATWEEASGNNHPVTLKTSVILKPRVKTLI